MRSWGLPPDFLRSLVASAPSMRLSLMKAAHVAVSWRRVQEIRVAPSFSAQVRPGEGHPSYSFGLCYAIEVLTRGKSPVMQ
jgi:hypothetical protein